jgi:branched-chain amino acid transport system substrate-binding protein
VRSTRAGDARRRGFLSLAPVVVAALLAAGCGASAGAGSAGEIKVGFVVPYSGSVAKYGQDADHAWQLATEKYGAAVGGRTLTQVKYDDKCQPSAAVGAVKQALGAGVVALIGPTCSGNVTATMAMASRQKIPLITQAYAPQITAGKTGYVWREPASDAVLNANLAQFVKGKGFTKVGVAHDTTGFGQAEGETIVAGLRKVGIEPVATLSYKIGAADFSGEIQRLRAAGVEAVCLMGYDPETSRIAYQLRQLGINVQVFSNQAISYDDSIKVGGAAVEGAFFYAPFLTDMDRFRPFVDAWQKKYNELPDTEGYMYYLSAVTVIEGLKNVKGAVTGEKLNQAIGQLDVDVDGMTRLGFTDTGDPKCPTVLVGTVSGGKPKQVEDDSPKC